MDRRRFVVPGRVALMATALALAVVPAGCARDVFRVETEEGHRVALEVAPAPPRPGELRVAATIADRSGAPVEGARVRLFYWMPYRGVPASPEQQVRAVETTPAEGRYTASVKLEKPGRWKIAVKVERPEAEPDLATFTVDVRD